MLYVHLSSLGFNTKQTDIIMNELKAELNLEAQMKMDAGPRMNLPQQQTHVEVAHQHAHPAEEHKSAEDFYADLKKIS